MLIKNRRSADALRSSTSRQPLVQRSTTMAPPAFDTTTPVKCGLNVLWMFLAALTSLMLFGVFFAGLLFDDEDPPESIEEHEMWHGWTKDRLCACNWIDEGRVLDPTCDANNTAKVREPSRLLLAVTRFCQCAAHISLADCSPCCLKAGLARRSLHVGSSLHCSPEYSRRKRRGRVR